MVLSLGVHASVLLMLCSKSLGATCICSVYVPNVNELSESFKKAVLLLRSSTKDFLKESLMENSRR